MATHVGFSGLTRRQVVLSMAGVMLALFLASLQQTVLSTAMPQIVADLQGFDRYTWVTTAYLMTSTVVVPVVGRLTDLYGRKWFYVFGVAIFLIGSALGGFSQTMTQLIVARAVQGIGGGVLIANAFVVIGDLFPPAERGKYQGLLGATFGISSVIGPTLGGLVTDQLSWHWLFYLSIPLGIPVVALMVALFPDIRPVPGKHRIDYLGVTALVLAVVPLLLALSWAGVQYPWDSAQVIGSLVFSGLMTVLFLVIESRAEEPIIPLTIFRNWTVSVSILATFLTGFGMFGGIIFIPLFFQAVLGASATSSGSFLTPMMLGIVVGSIIAGQAISRWGGHYRLQALAGLTIMGVGIYLLSRMSVNTSYGQAIINIVLMGFGLGITFPLYTIAVQNAVPHHLMGASTASVQFFRTIGGTLGLAILGSLLNIHFAAQLTRLVPTAVKEAMLPGRLSELARNPQALVNPEAQAQLQAGFTSAGQQGAELLQQLMAALRLALANAIDYVFLISLLVVAVAWVATVFMKETPLMGWGQPREERGTSPKEASPADD
jgi:EmrB/QacA subfamily drug resistance transporter